MQLKVVSELILLSVYYGVLVILALAGLHRYFLIYLRHLYRPFAPKVGSLSRSLENPRITVQLPVYNEKYVVARLIHAVCRLEYPRHLLEIQVLDDSTDETSDIVKEVVDRYASLGFVIHHVRRSNREGFKAGALDNGLKLSNGDRIVIFDADFAPPPNSLRRMLQGFSDERVGMVQARWGHLNRDFSVLTQIQALMIDSRFVLENQSRFLSGRFFSFNGTAGMWRRRTIEDAGGWQADTLTEDLDLSYRAQLRGWKFVYLNDLVIPAELPVNMSSFRSQQKRWSKGSVQAAVKLAPAIVASRFPGSVKLEALFHLVSPVANPLLFLLGLLILPTFLWRSESSTVSALVIDLPLMLAAALSVSPFSVLPERRNWMTPLLYLPLRVAVGIGLSLSNGLGVLEGLIGRRTDFVRTPKFRAERKADLPLRRNYRIRSGLLPLVEILMAGYSLLSLLVLLRVGIHPAMPILVLFGVGYFLVGFSTLSPDLWKACRRLLCGIRNMLVSAGRQLRSVLGREAT